MESVTCSVGVYHEVLRDLLEDGQAVALRARGRSMRPFIRAGDVLRVVPFDFDASVPGEVVVFRRDGLLVTHRMVGKIQPVRGSERLIVTAGDGLRGIDEPTDADRVVGTVTEVRRGWRTRNLRSGRWRITGRMMVFLGRHARIRSELWRLWGSTRPLRAAWTGALGPGAEPSETNGPMRIGNGGRGH